MSMAAKPAPVGLIGRVRASYWDFSGAVRRLIAERPSDAVLLSFLMIALAVQAFGGVIELVARQEPLTAAPDYSRAQAYRTALAHAVGGVIDRFAALRSDPALAPTFANQKLQTELMEVLVGRILFGALATYLIATLLTPICRALGGKGGYYETRAAVIWGMLVAAPPLFLQSVVSGLRRVAERDFSENTAVALSWGGYIVETVLLALAFVIWAGSLSGAHGFRSPSRVLGVLLAVTMAIAAIVWAAFR